MKIKVFLDDERQCPEGWTPAKTAQQAIDFLKGGNVETISLDHDLGAPECGTGNDVLVWIEEKVFCEKGYCPPRICIHTANPVARVKMQAGVAAIERTISRSTYVQLHRARAS